MLFEIKIFIKYIYIVSHTVHPIELTANYEGTPGTVSPNLGPCIGAYQGMLLDDCKAICEKDSCCESLNYCSRDENTFLGAICQLHLREKIICSKKGDLDRTCNNYILDKDTDHEVETDSDLGPCVDSNQGLEFDQCKKSCFDKPCCQGFMYCPKDDEQAMDSLCELHQAEEISCSIEPERNLHHVQQNLIKEYLFKENKQMIGFNERKTIKHEDTHYLHQERDYF